MGYLSFLKVGPSLLKFVPGQKVGGRVERRGRTCRRGRKGSHARRHCHPCPVLSVPNHISFFHLLHPAFSHAPTPRPPRKARDLRNWLTVYSYWNAGGKANVAAMLAYLCDEYLAPGGSVGGTAGSRGAGRGRVEPAFARELGRPGLACVALAACPTPPLFSPVQPCRLGPGRSPPRGGASPPNRLHPPRPPGPLLCRPPRVSGLARGVGAVGCLAPERPRRRPAAVSQARADGAGLCGATHHPAGGEGQGAGGAGAAGRATAPWSGAGPPVPPGARPSGPLGPRFRNATPPFSPPRPTLLSPRAWCRCPSSSMASKRTPWSATS